VNAVGSTPRQIRGGRAALGLAIALLSLPAVFFLGSMALVFMIAGGLVLGTSLAVDRNPVVRGLVLVAVLLGTVVSCGLLLNALL
jgi:hypothetical protein